MVKRPKLPEGVTEDLLVCPQCKADMVCATEWEEAGEEHWLMQLRCGACQAEREITCNQATANHYDERWDRSMDPIYKRIRSLERARERIEIERFKRALEADAILPEDFHL